MNGNNADKDSTIYEGCVLFLFLFLVLFCFQDVLQQAQIIFRKPLAECLDVAIKEVFPDKTKSQIKIIDAGAGTGLTGEELFKLGYTTIDALDISQEMLNEAKKKNIYKRLICAPLTEQQIPEIQTGEYHGLISTGALVIAHVRPEALEEMTRMVKPGKKNIMYVLYLNSRAPATKRSPILIQERKGNP